MVEDLILGESEGVERRACYVIDEVLTSEDINLSLEKAVLRVCPTYCCSS